MKPTGRGRNERSIDTLWDASSVRNLSVRPRTMILGLAGGALFANLLTVAAVIALLPSTAQPTSAGRAALASGVRSAGFPHGTPADRVVAELIDSDIGSSLGPGWRAGPVTSGTGSVPGICHPSLPAGPAAVFAGASRDFTGSGAGARLQVWAFGAGQGVAAESVLREGLSRCSGTSVNDAAGPTGGAAGFTARSTSGRQWVGWALRRRGDVLVSLTATAFAPVSGLDGAASTLDGRLTSLLAHTCSAQDEQPSAALTNPYAAGTDYHPHTAPVSVSGPTYAPAAEPAAEVPLRVTLPTPVPHPELAPPTVAPPAQWLDTNHDGVPDTPVPLAAAGRGPAPVYADPRLLRIPAGLVTTAPIEPSRPSVPTPMVVQTPTTDPTGPGCGWAFTGLAAPHEDPAELARNAQVDVQQAMVTLAAAQAAYQVEMVRWSRLEPAYRQEHAKYVAYETILQALHDAAAQQSQAQAAYANAVATYEQALAGAAQGLATPTPSSTSPPTPASTGPTGPAPQPSSTSSPTGSPAAPPTGAVPPTSSAP